MHFIKHSFRLAEALLEHRPAWDELQTAITSTTQADILQAHERLCGARAAKNRKFPAGAQSALNDVFEEKLIPLGWTPQQKLFSDGHLEDWSMDFIKDRIGVEVTFNHSEAIAWTFSRLNIAGESERVDECAKVEVGVAITATENLKRWGKMDSTVSTFEKATAWLREMKPILPIPILLIGLNAAESENHLWMATEAFRGTEKGRRTQLAPGQ
jgi:hypothetical protein